MELLDHEGVLVPEEIRLEGTELEQRNHRFVHIHLPQLEAASIIRWNRRQRIAARGPEFERMQPVLELLSDHRDEFPFEWV